MSLIDAISNTLETQDAINRMISCVVINGDKEGEYKVVHKYSYMNKGIEKVYFIGSFVECGMFALLWDKGYLKTKGRGYVDS